MLDQNEISSRVLGFLGDGADVYARFVGAMFSTCKKVLVADVSGGGDLFVGTAGDCMRDTLYIRSITYTRSMDYLLQGINNYDVIIIYDDFMDKEGDFCKYANLLDMSYICVKPNRYAIAVLLRIATCFEKYPNIPYCHVFEGTEYDAKYWTVKDYWKFFSTKRKGPEKIFYIPSCPSDYQAYLKLEYGVLCIRELSEEMQEFLSWISQTCGMENNAIQIVQTQRLFCR